MKEGEKQPCKKVQPVEDFAKLCSWENKVARLEKKRGGVCMF